MDKEVCKSYKLKNVPTFIAQNAIEWHNNVTGDAWDISMVAEPDIQHRITLIVGMCDEYDIVDGKVVSV